MKGPFFYTHENRQVGPLSSQELKQHAATGRLHPADRVWTEDAPKGCTAAKINGLFSAATAGVAGASPPPPNAVPPAPHVLRGSVPPPPPLPLKATPSAATAPSAPAPLSAPLPPTSTAPSAAAPSRTAAKIVKRVLVEPFLTAGACFSQVGRTFSFLRTRRSSQSAEKQAFAALKALGGKLDAEGLGDPALRSQLADLRERRSILVGAKASTKLLDAEEGGLHIRLATPLLDSTASPATLEPELSEARRLQTSLQAAQGRRGAQRLLPPDWAGRLRVAGGLVAAIFCLWFGWNFVPSGGMNLGFLGFGNSREVWLDENDFWPRRKAVGNWEGDLMEGEVRFYDDQDRLMAILNYAKGKLQGLATTFYPNGGKLQKGHWVDGLRTGTHQSWFDDGTLAQTSELADDLQHGFQVMYFKNGNKFAEGNYVRGKLEGKLNGYLEDGRCCNISNYANGEMLNEQQLIQCTDAEDRAVKERAKYPLTVKAHWPQAVQTGTETEVAGTSTVGTSSDWVRVELPEGPFSALYPVQPDRTERDVLAQSGGEISRIITYMADSDGIRYQVLITEETDLGKQVHRRANAAASLSNHRDTALNTFPGSQLLSESQISLGEYAGVEFTIEVPADAGGGFTRSRVYHLSDQPCNLIVSSFNSAGLTSKAAEKFLSSFKLSKPSSNTPVPTRLSDGGPPQPSRPAGEPAAFQGKRYQVYTEVVSWHEAKQRCEKLGGRLAIVSSKAENDFVSDLVSKAGLKEAWLGATDEQTEGTWLGVDGAKLSYTNWNPGQPNNKDNNEHYLLLWSAQRGLWADQPAVSVQHQPGYVLQSD